MNTQVYLADGLKESACTYCKVMVGSQKMGNTPKLMQTSSPLWDRQFGAVVDPRKTSTLRLYFKANGGDKDTMHAVIALKDFVDVGAKWHDIMGVPRTRFSMLRALCLERQDQPRVLVGLSFAPVKSATAVTDVLRVRVRRARGLGGVKNSIAGPWVCVLLDDKCVGSTRVARRAFEPEWNEQVAVRLANDDFRSERRVPLRIQLFRTDKASHEHAMGEVILCETLRHLCEGRSTWFKLQRGHSDVAHPSGEVELSFEVDFNSTAAVVQRRVRAQQSFRIFRRKKIAIMNMQDRVRSIQARPLAVLRRKSIQLQAQPLATMRSFFCGPPSATGPALVC